MRIIGIVVIALMAAIPYGASAHEPNYIGNQDRITIPDPGTSRAYYGELHGTPAEYVVTLSTTTKFYLGILAPDISAAQSNYDAVMKDASGKVVLELLHGTLWEQWYEEFGGDTYLKGPEERKDLPAGTYTITVDNETHTGKYVLAPGEEEVFTLGGTPETIRQIYLMKTKFFGKPPYTIFEGILGRVMLGVVVVILLIILVLTYFFFRRQKKKK